MTVSIVMPYYMRQAALDRSLAFVHALYHGFDYEIVICDDGSPDPVMAPAWCTVVHLPVKPHALNPCVPINRAVEASRGELLVLTNPEIEHWSPILPAMIEDCIGPKDYVMAACKDESGEWLCHSSVTGNQGGRGYMPKGSGFHFCTVFRRSLWQETGGFDEAYRDGQAFDDNDWLMRLESVGARFVLRDDLVVYHRRVPTRWPVGGHARNKALFESKWGVACGV